MDRKISEKMEGHTVSITAETRRHAAKFLGGHLGLAWGLMNYLLKPFGGGDGICARCRYSDTILSQ